MKYIILLLFLATETNGQKIVLLPKIGLCTNRFIGSGTTKQTSIIGTFNNVNNPFSNQLNLGIIAGIEARYKVKNKLFLTLSLERQSVNYNLKFNRTYDQVGFWKQIDGFYNLKHINWQTYLGVAQSLYKKRNIELISNIAISQYLSSKFKSIATNQTLYNGSVLDTVNSNKIIYPVNDLYFREFNLESFSFRFGMQFLFNNLSLSYNIDHGLKNRFSGKYKKDHDDGQNFIILPQSMSLTVAYRLQKNAKE